MFSVEDYIRKILKASSFKNNYEIVSYDNNSVKSLPSLYEFHQRGSYFMIMHNNFIKNDESR
jgi:hypothetical protein